MILCPACSNEIADDNYIRVFRSSYGKTTHKLYHCRTCDLEFWHPRDIEREYYEGEHCEGYVELHSGDRKMPEWCKPFFERFHLRSGRLLDIGCGDGTFLKAAERNGYEVWGVDFDRKSIETARNKNRLNNVYAMSLEEFITFASEKNISFDVITFFEVLEHQDEPGKFIETVKKLLAEGGFIAGSVPNRNRLFADSDRKLFMADYPPHHFLWFSGDSLKIFLRKNGFDSIEVFPIKMKLFKLSEWIESVMFGRASKRIKNKLNIFFLKRDASGHDLTKDTASTEKARRESMGISFLKFLRILRNIVFLPSALLIYPEFNRRGVQLYFQAVYRSGSTVSK